MQIVLAIPADIVYSVDMESNNKVRMHRTVAFRVPNEVYDEYARMARQERRRISEVLRFALEERLAAMKRNARRATKVA